MTRRYAVPAVAALFLLAGCAVGPKYRAPVVKTPEAFSEMQGQKPAADVAALADWWRTFHDQKLSSLVERAIGSNLDVKVAKARLLEARATFKNTQASKRLPAGNANFNYSRSRTSSDNPQIPKLGGGTLIPTTYSSYQSYLDASYELDLFGGVRHQIEAASADAQSYEDSLRNTLVSAVAEVSRGLSAAPPVPGATGCGAANRSHAQGYPEDHRSALQSRPGDRSGRSQCGGQPFADSGVDSDSGGERCPDDPRNFCPPGRESGHSHPN